MRKNIKNLTVVLVCLLVMTLPVTATYPPVVYLNDLPSTASYVIKTDGTNYWSVRYDGYTSVSSTNASYIINNAFGALTNTGGSIFSEHGTYICDSRIVVRNNTSFEGDGSIFQFAQSTGTTYGFYLFDVQNVTVKNFEIRYEVESAGSFQGMRISASGSMDVSHVNIDHVSFEHSSYWSMMLKGRIRYLHIDNCQFLSVRNYTGRSHIGIYADDAGDYAPCDIWLEHNYFTQHSFWIEDATARNMSVRWHINYNTFYNVKSDVIPAAGCSDSEIIGNIIYNDLNQNLNNGIDTQYANNVVIMGNTLNRTAASDTDPATASCGIFIGHEAAADVTIVANTIEGYDTGIICYGAANSTITSNVISLCTHGVYLGTDSGGMFCNFTIVSNNRIKSCSHWGIEEVNNVNIDYNVMIGNIVTQCTLGNIKTYGAHTEVHLCYNGTTWIS